MFNFFISLSAILIYLAAAYGWGRLATDRLYADNRPGWALTVVAGFGIWIFIGGLLNAARLAFPTALDAMLGLGAGLAIAFAYPCAKNLRITSGGRDARTRFRESFYSHWLPFAMIGIVLLFLVLTQMPASVFNPHDDFHTYMPRLMRMLETGSFGGNPFDVLGFDSLGAQAFMQSFFVYRLALDYVNAFDAISCFVLGLLLLGEMGRRFAIHWAFLLASLLTFIAIDPQYVNISALYSGSLMVLATVFASIVFADDMGGADNKRAFAGALAVALFLTSLISLKTTFIVFAATYFVVYFGCALYLGENKRAVTRSMFFTLLAAMILITPWILLSLPNYLAALRIALEGKALAVMGGNVGGMDFISKIAVVFSPRASRWGGNFLAYSVLASMLAAAGAAALVLLIRSRDIMYRQRLAAISAVCIAAAISYFANVHLLDPGNGIRYSIPILAAAIAVTVLLLVRNGLSLQSQGNLERSAAYAVGIAVLGMAVAIGGVFSGELVKRSQRAWQIRTLVSFPIDGQDLAYNQAALGKSAAGRVLDIQHRIGEGYAILASMSVPFQFDFARNPIFYVNEDSFLTPWSDFPLNAGPEAARRFLSDRDIRYVIWEYQGYGLKSVSDFETLKRAPYRFLYEIGETNIGFRKVLRYLAENSQVILADRGVVVFDITQSTPGRP